MKFLILLSILTFFLVTLIFIKLYKAIYSIKLEINRIYSSLNTQIKNIWGYIKYGAR